MLNIALRLPYFLKELACWLVIIATQAQPNRLLFVAEHLNGVCIRLLGTMVWVHFVLRLAINIHSKKMILIVCPKDQAIGRVYNIRLDKQTGCKIC